MLKPRRPIGAELLFHDFNEALRHLVLEFGRHFLQGIEGYGPFRIRRINDDHVVYAVLGDKIQNRLNHIAVRINKAQAVPIFNVLAHEEFQEL